MYVKKHGNTLSGMSQSVVDSVFNVFFFNFFRNAVRSLNAAIFGFPLRGYRIQRVSTLKQIYFPSMLY